MQDLDEKGLRMACDAYDRKYFDMTGPSPTEEPEAGGGPMGYAIRAYLDHVSDTLNDVTPLLKLRDIVGDCDDVTPGPWEIKPDYTRPEQVLHVVGPSEVVCGLDGICSPWRYGNDRSFVEDKANMRHIARCDPETMNEIWHFILNLMQAYGHKQHPVRGFFGGMAKEGSWSIIGEKGKEAENV